MIAAILARYGLHIGICAAVIVGYATWDASRVQKGVQKERQRVQVVGEKIEKKAHAARSGVAAKTIEKYYRD